MAIIHAQTTINKRFSQIPQEGGCLEPMALAPVFGQPCQSRREHQLCIDNKNVTVVGHSDVDDIIVDVDHAEMEISNRSPSSRTQNLKKLNLEVQVVRHKVWAPSPAMWLSRSGSQGGSSSSLSSRNTLPSVKRGRTFLCHSSPSCSSRRPRKCLTFPLT